YTPAVLGAALFRRELLAAPGPLPLSGEMVAVYTWVHGLVFCLIGGLASRLLALAEERPNLGFGIVLLFVVFEFGFVGVALAVAGRARRQPAGGDRDGRLPLAPAPEPDDRALAFGRCRGAPEDRARVIREAGRWGGSAGAGGHSRRQGLHRLDRLADIR